MVSSEEITFESNKKKKKKKETDLNYENDKRKKKSICVYNVICIARTIGNVIYDVISKWGKKGEGRPWEPAVSEREREFPSL